MGFREPARGRGQAYGHIRSQRRVGWRWRHRECETLDGVRWAPSIVGGWLRNSPPPSISRVASPYVDIGRPTHKVHAQTSKRARATSRIRRGFETIGSSRGETERDNAESTSGPTLSVHHEIEIWPAVGLRKRSRRDGRGSVRVLRVRFVRGGGIRCFRRGFGAAFAVSVVLVPQGRRRTNGKALDGSSRQGLRRPRGR